MPSACKAGRAVSLGLGNATALRGAGVGMGPRGGGVGGGVCCGLGKGGGWGGGGMGMGRRCDEFDGPGARSSGSGVDRSYGNAGLVLVAALLCHLANSGTQ